MRGFLSIPVVALLALCGPASAIELGDPAPGLVVDSWLPGPPEGIEGPSIVLLAGTWCATSRALLDHLEQVPAEDALPLLVIAAEDADRVARFRQIGGWQRPLFGADSGKVTWDAWSGEGGQSAFLPYAFVLDGDPRGAARVLWHGRAVQSDVDEPLAAFEDVLRQVVDGSWDLERAREEKERSAGVGEIVSGLREETNLKRIRELLGELERATVPADLLGAVAEVCNNVAWILATGPGKPKELEVAEWAIGLCMAHGGDEHPGFLDTRARVLWVLGQREEALAVQRLALELAQGTPLERTLRPALDEYAEALGVPADPAVPVPPWTGVINQAFSAVGEEQLAIVYPPSGPEVEAGSESESGSKSEAEPMCRTTETEAESEAESESDAESEPMCRTTESESETEPMCRTTETEPEERTLTWAEEMADLERTLFPKSSFHTTDEVADLDRTDRVLILYGTPESNPLLGEVLTHHGIGLDADGVRFADRTIAAPDPFLIASLPSPWQPELPVLVYAAPTGAHAVGLNAVFHGPTAAVIGSVVEGRQGTVVEADLRFEDGRAVDLSLGPGELSAEQATEDLRAVATQLLEEYAGYDDLAWALRSQGATWEDRTVAFEARIAEQPTWPFADFFDLLVEYLDPVQDTHFRMDGTALGPEGSVRRRAQLVDSLEPFFAEGVVDGNGLDIPNLPGPDRVEADTPYLFPTLPRDGIDPAYLVGVLADPDSPPDRIQIPDGEELRELDVHRGRVASGPRERTFRLRKRPETPLPVLGVWTMNRARLDGLSDTAAELRDQDLVVLDLRGNGGGSDMPAREWVARFSHQWFRWGCGSTLHKGERDPLKRWTSWSGSRFRMGGEDYPGTPFSGRLAVLADAGVASSGETFVFLASQIQGAVLLGENTSGCTAYGNVEGHDPLPHSRIELWFGRSRFVWECVRPVVEGVGVFPDYWLDDPDPIGWLADHPLP